MNEIHKDICQKRCQTAITALSDNGFTVLYAENAQEACQKALEMIPLGALVGAGGSNTIREMGLVSALQNRGQKVLDHWKAGLNAEEKKQIRKDHLSCDVFLASSNAMTMNGQLVNIDGTGNRVAAMIYGPGKIIIIAGVNKVVETLEDALRRIRNVSAPLQW